MRLRYECKNCHRRSRKYSISMHEKGCSSILDALNPDRYNTLTLVKAEDRFKRQRIFKVRNASAFEIERLLTLEEEGLKSTKLADEEGFNL